MHRVRELEAQLEVARSDHRAMQALQKQQEQESRSRDVRLNRALNEIEKYKSIIEQNREAASQQDVSRGAKEASALRSELKRVERQRNELIAVVKKQMKLVDILKRQRAHIEAAKLLSITEEEFIRMLDTEAH